MTDAPPDAKKRSYNGPRPPQGGAGPAAGFNAPLSDGRIPPHSVDAEQALLGSCILEGGQTSLTQCIEAKLKPEAFFKPAHQVVYKAMMSLYEEGTPVDEVILGEKLQAQNQLERVGGYAYINTLTSRIDTPAHLPFYLHRVRDTYLLRRLIGMASKTIEQAYGEQENLEQFLETVEQEIFKISEDRISDSARPLHESIDEAVNLVHKLLQRKGELTGVPTGFTDLDRMTFGLHPQEMIVLAARPSMGKTSLALNVAEAAILPKPGKTAIPTLMFSLEMSASQLSMRLLCGRARVNMSKVKDGFLSADNQRDLVQTAKELRSAPFWIDDSGNMTVLEMRAKARRMQAQLKNKLGLIIIDYLQLLSGTDTRAQREQQIAEISRGIKAMSKELNVPVIVLSQLNRESEKERRQPRLSDLRESGSIEQDADVVLLLAKRKDGDEDDEQAAVVLRDLIVAKQRNGPVGSVTLTFTRSLTRFENYTSQNGPDAR
jgi:replicative DNA helicase